MKITLDLTQEPKNGVIYAPDILNNSNKIYDISNLLEEMESEGRHFEDVINTLKNYSKDDSAITLGKMDENVPVIYDENYYDKLDTYNVDSVMLALKSGKINTSSATQMFNSYIQANAKNDYQQETCTNDNQSSIDFSR